MKKFLFFAVAVLAFGLSACSPKPTSETTEEAVDSTVQTEEVTPTDSIQEDTTNLVETEGVTTAEVTQD